MIKFKEITVPNNNNFRNVNVLEILVAEGEQVMQHDPLISIENTQGEIKSMPSPLSGTVAEVIVMLGERVSTGTPVILLETVEQDDEPLEDDADNSPANLETINDEGQSELNLDNIEVDQQSKNPSDTTTDVQPRFVIQPGDKNQQNANQLEMIETIDQTDPITYKSSVDIDINQTDDELELDNDSVDYIDLVVPDIGDFDDVEVIDVLAKVGELVAQEDPLVSLESDKATMDVPATSSGTIVEMMMAVGDRVSQGSVIARLQVSSKDDIDDAGPDDNEHTTVEIEQHQDNVATTEPIPNPTPVVEKPTQPIAAKTSQASHQGISHASPAIRKFARELGVDLSRVNGSGNKGRILHTDVQAWVKQTLAQAGTTTSGPAGTGIPIIPSVDFSQFGNITTEPLNRIKRLTAEHLHRSWLNVPHVTHNDEADITELEEFRQSKKQDAADRGIRLTSLAFVMKAVVAGLKKYPQFNTSLDAGGENLIFKQYYNIGIAVETEAGLVVPVVREVHRKSIFDLATELGELSERARNKKLKPEDLQGGCFTISSLGGIGGTGFTPIVNAPEVAILGVSRSSTKPVFADNGFVPRLMLPLSLSYDHRVIDGAEAARFTAYLCNTLTDVRMLLL